MEKYLIFWLLEKAAGYHDNPKNRRPRVQYITELAHLQMPTTTSWLAERMVFVVGSCTTSAIQKRPR